MSLAVGLVAWEIGPSWAIAIGGTFVTFVGSLGVLRLVAARDAARNEARDNAWNDTSWSREVVALDLADVTASVWGSASKPWIEIRSSFGRYDRDFPMSVLGASLGREGFLELAAALADRTAEARRRQGTQV